jgi:hypothetical protein
MVPDQKMGRINICAKLYQPVIDIVTEKKKITSLENVIQQPTL